MPGTVSEWRCCWCYWERLEFKSRGNSWDLHSSQLTCQASLAGERPYCLAHFFARLPALLKFLDCRGRCRCCHCHCCCPFQYYVAVAAATAAGIGCCVLAWSKFLTVTGLLLCVMLLSFWVREMNQMNDDHEWSMQKERIWFFELSFGMAAIAPQVPALGLCGFASRRWRLHVGVLKYWDDVTMLQGWDQVRPFRNQVSVSKTPGLAFSIVKHKCYWLDDLANLREVRLWLSSYRWMIPRRLHSGQKIDEGGNDSALVGTFFEKNSWEVHHRLSRFEHIQAKSFPVHFHRLPNATHTHWIQERTVCSKKHYSICHHRFYKSMHQSTHTHKQAWHTNTHTTMHKNMNTGTKLQAMSWTSRVALNK